MVRPARTSVAFRRVVCLALSLAPGAASARECQPQWAQGYGAARFDQEPLAFATFDDGTGPALYAGGRFTRSGAIATRAVARWNGSGWAGVGALTCSYNPTSCADVRQFAVFDDGAGPALYACGQFTHADGTPTPSIARWNGQRWVSLPDVFTRQSNPIEFNAMVVFDDGSGPALYVGGNILTVNGAPNQRVAKWTGSQWLPTPTNLPVEPTPINSESAVHSMAVFDDGAGPRLYAVVYSAGYAGSGLPRWLRVYRLDGDQWTLAPGAPTSTITNHAGLLSIDEGPARGMYLYGYYVPGRFWRFDGAAWTIPPTCNNLFVREAAVLDTDPPTLALARATQQSGVQIEVWDGATRSALGPPTPEPIDFTALHARVSGTTTQVFVGVGPASAPWSYSVAALDANSLDWAQVGLGSCYPQTDAVRFDDGSGPALYALGSRVAGDGVVHRLRGDIWQRMPPLNVPAGVNPDVVPGALAVLSTPEGPRLHALGRFDFSSQAGPPGLPNALVAQWNGQAWTPTARASGDSVARCAAMFDPGSGPELVVAGAFTSIEGVTTNHIARRTPGGWAALGAGFDQPVSDIAVFDDGAGARLYACGRFTRAGEVEALGLARWDGANWSPVPGFSAIAGLGADARKLAVGLLNGAPNLYVGGANLYFNRTNLGAIARFDGASWHSLNVGGAVTFVRAVGDGPTQTIVTSRVQVSPPTTDLGAVSFWDGAHWTGLRIGASASLKNIAIDEPDASGRIPLWLIGDFSQPAPISSVNIALAQLCVLNCSGDTNGDRIVDAIDLNRMLGSFGQAMSVGYSSANPIDLNGDGVINFADLNILLAHFGEAC